MPLLGLSKSATTRLSMPPLKQRCHCHPSATANSFFVKENYATNPYYTRQHDAMFYKRSHYYMPGVTTRKLTTVRINDSGTHKLVFFFLVVVCF